MAVERRKDSKRRVLKEGEYERPNGTYEFRWRDKTGRRRTVYGKTLEDLREKETDVLRDMLDGINPDSKNMTINDLYCRWKQVKRGLKVNTFTNYCYMYEQFVEPDFGNTKIDDLRKSDVRAFYNYLAETRSLKVSTVDSVHTVLHQVLELGVEDEYMRFNPSDGALKELKKARERDIMKRRALTVKEQEVFENYLALTPEYQHWQPIFMVMLYTGMRVGEVTGLRWCDLDMENEAISVNHTLVYFDRRRAGEETCGFAVNLPKTKAGERTIPMLPIVKEMFRMERQYQKENNLVCKSKIDGYTDFIFINRFGNVQHQGTLNKALKRIIRDCNFKQLDKMGLTLPPFSCHYLRHTFTTRMCEAGVNIKAMQEILGHADAETTMNIYADATKELKQMEMKSLGEYFDGLKEKQSGERKYVCNPLGVRKR